MSSKKLLRKQLRSVLKQIPQHQLNQQSTNVLYSLQGLKVFQRAANVALFMNMDHSEIKTMEFIKYAFKQNKNVYLPHCTTVGVNEGLFPGQTSKLIFYKMESFEDVGALQPRGKFKLREPTSGFNILQDSKDGLDLIILPAMAYDSNCFRLGHGAAFYDDFIKRHYLKFGRKPYLLGVGLQEQLVDKVPTEPHDEKLDGVIVNKTFYGNDTQ